jgi:hypothetical protein
MSRPAGSAYTCATQVLVECVNQGVESAVKYAFQRHLLGLLHKLARRLAGSAHAYTPQQVQFQPLWLGSAGNCASCCTAGCSCAAAGFTSKSNSNMSCNTHLPGSPASPSSSRWSVVSVPVLSKQHTSTCKAKHRRQQQRSGSSVSVPQAAQHARQRAHSTSSSAIHDHANQQLPAHVLHLQLASPLHLLTNSHMYLPEHNIPLL